MAPCAGLAGLPNLRTPRGIQGPARLFPRRRGLGAGSATGEKIGGAITSAAAVAGPFAPIVAGVGALVSLISSFIGGGCGNACIESSQAEQIYEYAGQCLDAVASAGMLSQSQLLAGLQALLQGGQQHMQALEASDASAKNGYTNLTKALNEDISAANSIPATAANALDLTAAQSLFPSTTGWYAAPAQAGAQLALSYLQALPASSASTTSSGAGTVTILGTSVSTTTLLWGAALVAAALYFSGD